MQRAAIIITLAAILVSSIGCNSGTNQPTAATPMPSPSNAKRYHLAGKVVSVDKRAHMLNVDGQDIPGFMPAMTMPYNVKPESELDKLFPGDSISADIVVQGERSWLENVSVTANTSATAPTK